MKYMDVEWLHVDASSPTRITSEIDDDGYEVRKIEFWSDGRVGYASKTCASRDTALADVPISPIEEINSQTEFRAKLISPSVFQELWDCHVAPRKRRIECSVTMLLPSDGGRSTELPPGGLSGDKYRPHLVIGDPNQRQAIIAEGNYLTEEYIGVAFHDGPSVPAAGVEMMVVLTPLYAPHPMYEKLQPGVTFTVREGSKIVGYGAVRRWIE